MRHFPIEASYSPSSTQAKRQLVLAPFARFPGASETKRSPTLLARFSTWDVLRVYGFGSEPKALLKTRRHPFKVYPRSSVGSNSGSPTFLWFARQLDTRQYRSTADIAIFADVHSEPVIPCSPLQENSMSTTAFVTLFTGAVVHAIPRSVFKVDILFLSGWFQEAESSGAN